LDQAHFQRHLLSASRNKAFRLIHLVCGACHENGARIVSWSEMAAGRRRPTLRSRLVYSASKEIPNRFQLCQTTSKAARVLHVDNTPTGSTINRALENIAHPTPNEEEPAPSL
jgi:hypothetical protein